MEYTIKSLAQMSGVSTRTLRYYDEIDLLKPARINSSGYRIYTQKEVDLLQQILFYKSIDMKLDDLKKIVLSPNFDINEALINHYKSLNEKRDRLSKLILTVEKTIAHNKGEVEMSNKEKFEAFKNEKVEINENKYGNEIREKYGDEGVEKSNKKFLNLSEEDYNRMQEIEASMFENLKVLIEIKDLESDEAKAVFEKHKQWLGFTWASYSGEAHVGLASMYIHDERFKRYYNDKLGEDAAQMLHDAIVMYAK